MIDGFNTQEDMINSVCDGFINRINTITPNNFEPLCNQDGYEILTNTFGEKFLKKDIESANTEQLQSIANDLKKYLEREINIEEVCCFINASLSQSFDKFNAVQHKL